MRLYRGCGYSIHLAKLVYNLIKDLSHFLMKLSLVEDTRDKIFYIEDKYVHFPQIRSLNLVNNDENSIFF